MGKRIYGMVVVLVALGLVMGLFGSGASLAEPVKMKAVAFLPQNNANVAGF